MRPLDMVFRYVAAVTLVCGSIATADDRTGPASTPSVLDRSGELVRFGMNAGVGAMDYDPSEMFADVMKSFRQVTKPDGVTPVAVDDHGWPLADCRFLVWHGLVRAPGTYALRFAGSASTVSAVGAVIENVRHSPATNTTTADLVYDGSSNQLYLVFLGTAGGIKDVRLIMPGHGLGETWNRDFLAALAPVDIIRLMDFTATNFNHDVHWADRTRPDAASQQSHPAGYGWQGKGIAWEYAIDLLNLADKDGWINIPAEATSAYVDSLINLIKFGGPGCAPLEAGRRLYVEYSNEVWNGIFDQAAYNHEQALIEVGAGNSPLDFDGETNPYYWSWRRVAKRIVEISNQFRAAFGDEQMMTRIRPILAWQSDNGQATAANQLDFIQKYYGTNHWGYPDPRRVNEFIWGGGGALYYDDIPVDQDPAFRTTVETDSKWASAYGIQHCNYEGGIYFDGDEDPDWYEPWVTQNVIDHHRYYEEHGGRLLMYFTLTATWGDGLGFLHAIRDLDTRKYDAILQLSQQTQAWDNAYGDVLPLHRNGAQFTLGRVDWYVPPSVLPLSPLQWSAYHFDADATGLYRVWIEYSAEADIIMDVYAGGDLLATIEDGTNGSPATTGEYIFASTPGLRAVRVENHGDAAFNLIGIHVEQVQATSVGDDSDAGGIAGVVAAMRNHPNPFGTETVISFDLRRDARVAIELFDTRGRRVSTMLNGLRSAGWHDVALSGTGLPAGVYLCRASTSTGDAVVRKMIHVK